MERHRLLDGAKKPLAEDAGRDNTERKRPARGQGRTRRIDTRQRNDRRSMEKSEDKGDWFNRYRKGM